MAINRIMSCDAFAFRIDAVRDDLVAVQVEVDPVGIAASLGASQNITIEMARGIEIVDGEGDVEGSDAGHAPH